MNNVLMQQPEIEQLIAEYVEIGEELKYLQHRRKIIRDNLKNGRTEGVTLDFYKSPSSWQTAYSAYLLKKHVPPATLALCRVSVRKGGSVRIVSKKKLRVKK